MWSIFRDPDWGICDADDDVRASVGQDCGRPTILAFLQRQEAKHFIQVSVGKRLLGNRFRASLKQILPAW